MNLRKAALIAIHVMLLTTLCGVVYGQQSGTCRIGGALCSVDSDCLGQCSIGGSTCSGPQQCNLPGDQCIDQVCDPLPPVVNPVLVAVIVAVILILIGLAYVRVRKRRKE